jgi:hypothetical protein
VYGDNTSIASIEKQQIWIQLNMWFEKISFRTKKAVLPCPYEIEPQTSSHWIGSKRPDPFAAYLASWQYDPHRI